MISKKPIIIRSYFILFLTVIISLSLFFYGRRLIGNLKDLRESEIALFTESQTVDLYFSEFQRALGFGGYIHNVKEYMLHRNTNQLLIIKSNIEEIESSYTFLRKIFQEEESQSALATLDSFINVIRKSYNIMLLKENQNLDSKELDSLLELESPEILSALITLETFKDNYNRRARRQIQTSIDDLVADLLIASFLLPLILIIGAYLIYLLNRSYRISGELEIVQKHLSESRDWLEATGNTAKVGGWEIDGESFNVKWTKETYKIFEIETNCNVSLEDTLSFFPSQSKEYYEKKLQGAFQDGTSFEIELPFEGSKGKKGFVHIICNPILSNKNIFKLRGAIQEVTERKQLEEQLQQAHKMEAIGLLAGGIAHDFNNILSTIINAAQLISVFDKNLNEKTQKYLDMILTSSNRAADLTTKLLAFGGKGTLIRSTVDFHSLIDEVESIFKQTIDKSIKITVTKTAESFYVDGDISSLQNAIMNLGINASHAMPDGGDLFIKTRNVILDEESCKNSLFELNPGLYFEIEMIDTGIGIDDQNKKRIFDPFFTTKETGKGTGLGLASVFRTIQDHHGSINVNSEQNKGTQFKIHLPCINRELVLKDQDLTLYSGSGVVLIVDDEKLVRETTQTMLENMGFSVLMAENGKEALDIYSIHQSEIKFVLLDMIMPDVRGDEVFYKLREIDNHCNVIISSGYTKDENLQLLKNAGLAGFIRKPYRNYELSQMIFNVLNS